MSGILRFDLRRVDLTNVWIISGVLLVILIISMWRIFTKANVSGWKCLIPIYSNYQLWNIAWDGGKFLTIFWGSIGLGVLSFLLSFLGYIGAIVSSLLSIAWSIYALVMTFKMSIRLGHRFGKSTAFGVIALALFSIVGYPILAFSKANYNAYRDCGDGILRSDEDVAQIEQKSVEYWNRFSDQ